MSRTVQKLHRFSQKVHKFSRKLHGLSQRVRRLVKKKPGVTDPFADKETDMKIYKASFTPRDQSSDTGG